MLIPQSHHQPLPALVAAAVLATAVAQPVGAAGTWTDPGTSTFNGAVQARYFHHEPTAGNPVCVGPNLCIEPPDDPNTGLPPRVTGWIPDFFGYSFGQRAEPGTNDCFERNVPGCPVWGAQPWSSTIVDGVGTSTIVVTSEANVQCKRTCDLCVFSAGGVQFIEGIAEVNSTVDMVIDTVPPGEPVLVHFAWFALVNRQTDHEGFGEDLTGVQNVRFDVNLTSLIPLGSGNLNSNPATPNGTLFFPAVPGQSTGVIAAQGGDTITIRMIADVEARIASGNPGDQYDDIFDRAFASFYGTIVLSIDEPVPPFLNPALPGASVSEFSVDIGSDGEMSDPLLDGNEVFDPGDTYAWNGPALVPPGADGVRDDALAYIVDVWPDPDPAPPWTPDDTRAETCSVPFGAFDPLIAEERFDLDGTDAIDAELRLMIPVDQPLGAPFARFASDCINEDRYLLISYDDDGFGHYAWDVCHVPSAGPSPIGATYGTDAAQDEVIMVRTAPPSWPPVTAFGPAGIGGITSVASESALHVNLAPSPDPALTGEDFDDDVDALDVNASFNSECGHWYISADKEAAALNQGVALDPASIYEVLPTGGMVEVINREKHLGLPAGTDINAFEFVWLRWCDPDDPTLCSDALALLFSVDEIDFLMPGDESGGLDPRMIYASFFTDIDGDGNGDHFPYTSDPLQDNVDAIAASRVPFAPARAAPLFNDQCAGATVINAGLTAFSTHGATTDGPPEPCGFLGDIAGNSDADTWFEFVAPCSGIATLRFEPQFEQLFAIYQGLCPLAGGALMTCGVAPAGSTEHTTLSVIAGESYIIRIGGVNGQQGSGALTISCPCDSFDSYQPLFRLPSQSAWEPWGGVAATSGIFVSGDQSVSAPFSLAIDGDDDAVHEYFDRTSGRWSYTASIYTPVGMNEVQYFILLNTYPALESNDWSLQVELDGATGTVNDFDSAASLTMIKGQWTEIRVVIDLDLDEQSVFYDDQLLVSKSWSGGVEPGGDVNIAAVDLWANGSSGTMYFDDLCLTKCGADINCDGVVGFADVLIVLSSWGPCAGCAADLNGDGVVGFADLLIVLSSWN